LAILSNNTIRKSSKHCPQSDNSGLFFLHLIKKVYFFVISLQISLVHEFQNFTFFSNGVLKIEFKSINGFSFKFGLVIPQSNLVVETINLKVFEISSHYHVSVLFFSKFVQDGVMAIHLFLVCRQLSPSLEH
jgi:hypothetical protein